MVKSYSELEYLYYHLLDYFASGEMSFVILKTLRDEYHKNKATEDDIFIGSLIISTYNMAILSLANVIKPNSDSINLPYLFNCIKSSEKVLDSEVYANVVSFISEYKSALGTLSQTIDGAIKLRDTSIAHLDRRKINSPTSLLLNPPVRWDELNTAYSIVGSGLTEIGKVLGFADFRNVTTISNLILAERTRMVYRFLYSV